MKTFHVHFVGREPHVVASALVAQAEGLPIDPAACSSSSSLNDAMDALREAVISTCMRRGWQHDEACWDQLVAELTNSARQTMHSVTEKKRGVCRAFGGAATLRLSMGVAWRWP